MNIVMYLNLLTILICLASQNVSANKSKGDTDVTSDIPVYFSDCKIISGLDGNPLKYKLDKGENGDKGTRGGDIHTIGPPGISGTNGKCLGDITVSETEKDPLEAPCKFYNLTKSDYYNLRSPKYKESKFKVFCNKDTLETCIRGGKSDTTSFEHKTSPFWLTEIGIDIKDIYNGDISWLQERSSYARQVLKYGCKHSVPYSRIHLNKSVELLTWNDLVIGPFPSQSTPLFYSVAPKTDFCGVKYSDKNKGALIEIRSTNKNRLPIIDIRINNVDEADRTVSIENVELCFG